VRASVVCGLAACSGVCGVCALPSVLPGLFLAQVVIAETVLKPQMIVDCVWSADHRTFPLVSLL
jgi:hypothetical protein